MYRMHQATIVIAATLALSASTAVATASTAATATLPVKGLDVVTCKVDSTVKFSPGLTLQSQSHTPWGSAVGDAAPGEVASWRAHAAPDAVARCVLGGPRSAETARLIDF